MKYKGSSYTFNIMNKLGSERTYLAKSSMTDADLVWTSLRIEHGGLGVKRDALFKELLIYSCIYEL